MPGRILIVDERVTARIELAARLAQAAHEVIPCADAAQALAAARKCRPDLVLLSAAGVATGCLSAAQDFRALPGGVDMPVALLGGTADRASRIAALEAGIDAFLEPMPVADMLLARVRNLLRRSRADGDLLRAEAARFGFADRAQHAIAIPGQIALIAPSIETGLRWRNGMLPLMRDRIDVLNPDRALSELNGTRQPDAIVVAPDPGDPGRALRLLSDLRCRPDTGRAAILLVQDRPDPALAAMALDLGVDDLVESGFDCIEMVLRLRRELARKARSDRYRSALQDGLRLAATDPLTGLYNRRYAMAELARMLAAGGGAGLSVMLLDLDRFKRVNDTYGHAAGDTVLSEVSRRMKRCLREGDFLARIGGEEFLAVIRTGDPAAAKVTAERLRRAVSDRAVRLDDGTAIDVTLSIGLVQGDAAGAKGAPDRPAALLDLADRALYAAKTEGRNQVSEHATAA